MMDENVFAVFLFDKTITLLIAKPFYDSFCQLGTLLC